MNKSTQTIRDCPNLQGGYNPRLTAIELSEKNGALQTPDCRNVAMFYPGAIEKRLGKTKQGNAVSGAAWASQASESATQNISATSNKAISYCQKIVAGSSTSISSVTVKASANAAASQSSVLQIRADSAGSPGAIITNGTSAISNLAVGTTPTTITYTFSIPPSVLNTITYWFCVVLTTTNFPTTADALYVRVNAGSSDLRTTVDNFSTFTAGTSFDLYYVIQSASMVSTGQGLYDFKYGPNVTQVILVAVGGALYYKNGSNYTSIKSGLVTGADNLFDFITYKGIMVSCDYGTTLPQAWDAIATSTMELGYRMSPGYSSITGNQYTVSSISGNIVTYTTAPNSTFIGQIQKLSGGAITPTSLYLTVSAFDLVAKTVTYSTAPNSDHTTMTSGGFTTADASGGTIAAGTYRIMSVTALKSGGFRASAETVHVSAGGSKKIALTNIKANISTDGTQYAWDIDVTATKWFMTLAGGTIYYKIPSANMDIGGSATTNPPPNATTAFNISTVPVAGTDNTLDLEYNLPQAYFTNQIDCPKFKYMTVYQDMIVGAGDPNNLNSDWFSEQGTLHVWSNQGGYRGFRLGVSRDDGQVIKGLKVRNGRLYTLRTKSAFVQNYTGNASLPFTNDQIQSQLGCLSHWSIKDVDEGFKFLSQQGPAICYGNYITIDPKAEAILSLWEPNDTNRLNMSLCLFSTAFINESRKVIGWTVASKNATIRDLILRNNYELGTYWLDDSLNANYLTQVSDANGLSQPWSVDLSAQVFQHDSGTNDNGSAINWYWSTPAFQPLGVGDEATNPFLRVLGDVQSSGTLYIDEYLNQSATVNATYSIDMTRTDFRTGINVGMSQNSQGGFFRYVFRNSDLDVPVKINGFKFICTPARYQH